MDCLELTPEQQKAVQTSTVPVRLINPVTKIPYVLLQEDIYQKFQGLFSEGPLTEGERRAIIAGVWKRAQWDDPAMDDYAKLIPPKP